MIFCMSFIIYILRIIELPDMRKSMRCTLFSLEIHGDAMKRKKRKSVCAVNVMVQKYSRYISIDSIHCENARHVNHA